MVRRALLGSTCGIVVSTLSGCAQFLKQTQRNDKPIEAGNSETLTPTQTPTPEVAVSRAWTDRHVTGRNIPVRVGLLVQASQRARKFEIELREDGAVVKQQSISFDHGESRDTTPKVITLAHSFENVGKKHLSVNGIDLDDITVKPLRSMQTPNFNYRNDAVTNLTQGPPESPTINWTSKSVVREKTQLSRPLVHGGAVITRGYDTEKVYSIDFETMRFYQLILRRAMGDGRKVFLPQPATSAGVWRTLSP